MSAATARTVYYVVHHEGRWKFEVNDEDHGPFCIQATAIRAAVDAAHSVGKKGGDAQVVVQGEDNKFRTEWTYGRDPYPPLIDMASVRAGAARRLTGSRPARVLACHSGM